MIHFTKIRELCKHCDFNHSMLCHYDVCHMADKRLLDIIERHLATDTLKSIPFNPESSSFKHDAREMALVKRADVAVCLPDRDVEVMLGYFKSGRVSRRVCDVFHFVGEEHHRRRRHESKQL